ncbi:MAG: Nif3-like dinuclear metal center hexameric protein [Gammaproteobacteria bacterium]|nr:Nif3-like dinuclear metal center hexameric protein [Gammaproteobacteria bacterium]
MSKNTQTKKSATRSGTGRRATVQDFCIAMESIAPTGLAQSWDNVGLLVGDPAAPIRRIMACIDLTPAVVEEGIRKKTDLILAYHPPIFKPVSTIRADSSDMDAVVFRCIQHGMAIYATHTALDAAEGGTNDVIAALCGINETQPLEYADEPGVHELKLVTFVPADRVDTIAEALFAAGAGRIGDYDKCSYRIPGQGTFFGSESTNPSIGRRGRLERIDEIRLETVVPTTKLPAVVNALMSAHPYDQPAFDIYPLQPRPMRGIGRLGKLPRTLSLSALAGKLKKTMGAGGVQIVGAPGRAVDRAIIVVGAAGSLPFRIPLRSKDVIITGEIRHHDALTIERHGCSAIALGHWTSERPVLVPLTQHIKAALSGLNIHISTSDREPFRAA